MAPDRDQIESALGRLADIADKLGDAAMADEARAARERVENARFFVACVGQFKRGKSTLLDALLGDTVLPTGVTPVTAVPTVVRFGHKRAGRVREAQGDWKEIPVDALAEYVSEELNPGNARGIRAAEVLEPAPLLANGLCLVDTPGLGSVFDANTQATLAFVPHIDVALVVIGTDPPLSGDELRLIESASRHVTHLLVVLNKADRAEPHERAEACAFSKRMIEQRLGRSIERVFEVSARDQLHGALRWPDWDQLVDALHRLAAGSGASVSLAAGHRAVSRIHASLSQDIARAEDALKAPIEATNERVERLGQLIAEAERKLEDLSPVLASQESRLATTFSEIARDFRKRIASKAHEELRRHVRANTRLFGPRFRREAMAAAQNVTREAVAEWMPQVQRRADDLYRESMRRFTDAATGTWRAVRDALPDDLRSLRDVDEIAATLTTDSRFRFNEQITIAQPASPLRYLADAALGVVGLRGVILADAHRFLDWLLELNVGRVESDLVERVRDGRTALERTLRTTLASTRRRAQAALERAQGIREAGAAAIGEELRRLASLREELASSTEND